MKKSKFIEKQKEYWANEFAEILGVSPAVGDTAMVSMACYTMLYKIVDDFRGGEFRQEILDYFELK